MSRISRGNFATSTLPSISKSRYYKTKKRYVGPWDEKQYDKELMDELNSYIQSLDNYMIVDMVNLLNGKSSISLEFFEWFLNTYCRKNKVIIKSYDAKLDPLSSFNRMRRKLGDAYFEIFPRGKIISYNWVRSDRTKVVKTTIGQLNFLKWLFQNRIINYIRLNHPILERAYKKYKNPEGFKSTRQIYNCFSLKESDVKNDNQGINEDEEDVDDEMEPIETDDEMENDVEREYTDPERGLDIIFETVLSGANLEFMNVHLNNYEDGGDQDQEEEPIDEPVEEQTEEQTEEPVEEVYQTQNGLQPEIALQSEEEEQGSFVYTQNHGNSELDLQGTFTQMTSNNEELNNLIDELGVNQGDFFSMVSSFLGSIERNASE